MTQKRALSPEPSHPQESVVYVSDPIEDRDSIFVAHFSRNKPRKVLQALKELESATHRIAAWRVPSKQRSLYPSASQLYDTGWDDDGEKYGGKRLLNVLEAMNVQGAAVVARWYGGVMLGPVRFTHIEQCARQAIKQSLEAKQGVDTQEAGNDDSKRRKVDTEDEDRQRLIAELPERDESISSLRQLLARKRGEANNNIVATQSPSKPPKYSAMPIGALRRLDKARDASIAYLLQSIDKAENAATQSPTGSKPEEPKTTDKEQPG